METILEIIDKRNLYTHLILFKLYLNSNGRINEQYKGNLRKEVLQLLDNDFNEDDYNSSIQWLYSKHYLKNVASIVLSEYGRDYLEEWALEFKNINLEEEEFLKQKLSKKVYEFLGITAKASTVGNFLFLLSKIN